MRTEILLSLRSLSSFFDFLSSDDVAASRPLLASLFSLSECRLRLELEPFNNDGRPKLNTDDFFVDPGTVGDDRLVSFVGDIVLGAWGTAGALTAISRPRPRPRSLRS